MVKNIAESIKPPRVLPPSRKLKWYSISRNYSTTLTPPLGSDPSPSEHHPYVKRNNQDVFD